MKKIIFAVTIIFLVSGCSQNTSTFDLPENQGVSSERNMYPIVHYLSIFGNITSLIIEKVIVDG
jgi:PBP1b-binding outer membrane lipoprotein LpoB